MIKKVGGGDLNREVKLAHVVDVSELQRWVNSGTLLLTTAISWPRDSAALSQFGETLAKCNVAGVILAVPKYFAQFPEEVMQPLALAQIPCFELAWDMPFVQLIQEVHDFILREQSGQLRRSERIHRALTRAALSGNLSDVAHTLAEQLECHVVILSKEGLVLTPGDAPQPEYAKKALQQAGNAPRTLEGGTLIPIVLRGSREGGVWLSGYSKHRNKRDQLALRAAEHAATVAGLLLLAQRDAEVLEARLGYAFVDTLLEGRFTDDPSGHERAARIGFNPKGRYSVGLLVLADNLPLTPEGFSTRERAAQLLREVLTSLGGAPLVSVQLNYVWFLLPETVSIERVWARLGWAQPDNPNDRDKPVGGLVYGRVRVGAEGIAKSRAELLALAAYARAGQLRSYAEVLVPRVLSGDLEAQADLMNTLLGPLRQARNSEVLLTTIQTLCDTGFSQVETAQVLKIHANTLRYRIERVETLTGRSLSDPEQRSLWWLALQLQRIQGQG